MKRLKTPTLAIRVCEWCDKSHIVGFKVWWDRCPATWTLTHTVCDSADAQMEAWEQRQEERVL